MRGRLITAEEAEARGLGAARAIVLLLVPALVADLALGAGCWWGVWLAMEWLGR